MWTLKSKSVRRIGVEEIPRDNQGNLQVGRRLQVLLTLVFTDGTEDIEVNTFVSAKDDAKAAIKQNLARLNEQVELVEEVATDTLDLSEPTPPEKTQQELAQDEWVKAWGNLQKIQPLIDAGVLDGTETPVVNLRKKVKDDFRPAYLDLI